VLAVDLVTADGRHLKASEKENPELFWGLRGGGGNFGVATHFTLRLHEVGPTVMCAVLLWDIERFHEPWEAYAEVAENAPDALGCTLGVMTAPAAPFIPEELHGRKVAGFFCCWSGDPAQLDALLAPLLACKPEARFMSPASYRAVQRMVDTLSPHGRRSYWKSAYLKTIERGVAQKVVAQTAKRYCSYSQAEFTLFGGAVARVPECATAFGDRTGKAIFNIVANWTDPREDDHHKEWARSFFQTLQPYSTATVYVNFLGDEGEDRIRAAYGAKYDRLARLKRTYDPDNVFRSNQNILPSP
jgi:hypothetical protein